MNITIDIELSKVDLINLRQCSIERVMNNGIKCGEELSHRNDGFGDDGSILMQDCEEHKALVTKIWNTLREATWNE
tara:strand:+ start:64 stop:291 length:228 start_codon:yes stop_codon:yes gene_type:complete